MGFRGGGRVLGDNNVAVLYWIREYGKAVETPASNEPVEYTFSW
jgi:hypothetical protein